MVVKGLSVDLADRGIVVVAFAPGWVRTDMGGEGAELNPEESIAALRKSIEALTPADSGRYMDRFGEDLPW